MPRSYRQVFSDQIDKLSEHDHTEPSTSPWNAPMILVPKKDGSCHPTVDYCKLNKLSIPNRFPIPSSCSLLQDIGEGHSVFSTLELQSRLFQVEMIQDSRPLKAFSTPQGHFQFKSMPFGFRNSLITFSRLMTILLAGLIGNTVFLYLDDLLVVSRDKNEHELKLRKIYQRLSVDFYIYAFICYYY